MLQGELHVRTCTFIPGLSRDGLCIPGIPGYSDKGHAARRTTCTYMYIHPGIILGLSVYPRNPRILGQGACCKENYMYMYIHPGIILGWSVYPRNPRILGQGACCKENYMYSTRQKKLPINGPFNGPPAPVPFPFNVRSTSVQCPFVARLIPVHF